MLVRSVPFTIGNRGMRILNLNVKYPFGYKEDGSSPQRVMGQSWVVVGSENLNHMSASRKINWMIKGSGDDFFK